MPVNALNDFERHGSCALDGIKISTGRTETAFAAKRNEFERTTRRTPIHSSALRGISAMNHLFDVFKDNRASFEGVLDFFIVVRKDLLQDIHSNIVQQKLARKYPLMNEGAGGS